MRSMSVTGEVLIAKTNNCVNERIIGTLLSGKRSIVTSSLQLGSISDHTRRVRAGLFRSSDGVCSALKGPSIYLRVT